MDRGSEAESGNMMYRSVALEFVAVHRSLARFSLPIGPDSSVPTYAHSLS